MLLAMLLANVIIIPDSYGHLVMSNSWAVLCLEYDDACCTEPWMMAMSHSRNMKYYFNTLTREALYETPKDSVASYLYVSSRDLRIFFFVRISNRPSDSFSNRIFESNRPYTTQAVTQPNGLQAYCTPCYRPIICWRLALWTCVLYLIHRYCICDEREWCTDYGTPNWVSNLFISIQS